MSMILNSYRYATAGGFSPLDISGCIQWCDASDFTTMFDATSGGSNTADGAAVRRWEDKSGSNYHFIEQSSSAAAIRQAGAVNSLDVLEFSGGNEGYIAAISENLTAATVFVAIDATSRGAFARYFSMSTAAVDYSLPGGFIPLLSNNSSTNVSSYSNPAFAATATFPTGSAAVLTSRHTGSVSSIYVSGQAGTDGSFTLNKTFTRFGIGYSVGDPSNPEIFAGNLMEVIVYSSSLSNGDREAVENYLGAKWGITITH